MSPPHGDALAVVVVNYGSSDLLERNLARDDLRPPADRVVVVDNHSSDSEARSLRSLGVAFGWDLVFLPTNTGFGAAMNAGVQRARQSGCSFFLLLNPDARIDADVLRALHEDCRAHPLRMVAPRIVLDDGNTWFDGGTVLIDRGRTSTASGSDSSSENGWLTGACLMVHERLWQRVGGFDDDYFLYWEDVDLSWRCRLAGGQLRVRRDLSVLHSVGGTQAGRGKSPSYVYYNCRNRMLFAGKHLRPRTVLAWFTRSPGYAWAVMRRGGNGALLRSPFSLAWAAVRGTASGSAAAFRLLSS